MKIIIDLFIKGLNKLVSLPRYRKSDEIVSYSNKNKLRTLEIEQKYMEVRYKFNTKMKQRKIKRATILKIRYVLKNNVSVYFPREFENDAHAIYVMLKAKDMTVKTLNKVESHLDN